MIGYCGPAPGSLFIRVLAIDFGRCGVLVTSGVEVKVSGAAAGEGGWGCRRTKSPLDGPGELDKELDQTAGKGWVWTRRIRCAWPLSTRSGLLPPKVQCHKADILSDLWIQHLI